MPRLSNDLALSRKVQPLWYSNIGNYLSTCPSFNEQINSLRKIKLPERTIKTSMFSDRSTQNPTGCLRQGRRCVPTSDSLFAVACLPTPPYPHTTPPSLLLF